MRCLSLILSLFMLAGAGRAAELLSGPYVIAIEKTGATVCWQTMEKASGKLRYRAKGAAKWSETAGKTTRFQAVTLAGLKPGGRYEVEVRSGKKKLGGLSFGTAPEKLEAFTFFVYGDTRSDPIAHALVAGGMAAEARRLKQFTFTVITGDLARNGSDEEATARQFFDPGEPLLGIMPIAPLRGNHECGTKLFGKYFPAPPRPKESKNADDYVVDYGSVRVIILDQYAPARSKGPRMKWLAARLAEAEDKWRFVAFHEPIYSSGAHGSNRDFRKLVQPFLIQGKVHAVFAGHDHNYERTKPVGGVTHFTAGGGGAPLRRGRPRAGDTFSVKFVPTLHFLTVTVTKTKLTVKAHAPKDGKFEVFDQVNILKDCKWPARKPVGAGASSRGADSGDVVAAEVFYGGIPNPWREPIMIGGLALLTVALVGKAAKVAAREQGPDAAA